MSEVKKSFAMAYHGGEIWIEHLDGFYEDSQSACPKFEEDWIQFRKPSASAFVAI